MIISEKQQFLDWMEDAKWILPPKMTLSEAKVIWERKVREDNECCHECDGVHHFMQSKSNPDKFIAPIWKCKMCGEFYHGN